MEQPGNPGSIRGTRDRVFARREGSAYDTTSSDFLGRVRQRVARRLLFNFVYKNFWSRATETLERSRRAVEKQLQEKPAWRIEKNLSETI